MEKRNNMKKVLLLCLPFLLAACGTKQAVVGSQENKKPTTENVQGQQSEAVRKLTFVQKVSDNQVYAKNIVGNMDFTIQMGDKNISVPGALRMRKDEVIRIQLFIPILGTEVGRLEFTPTYVLIIDRLHKEYIKADYTQVDFLKRQGINFYSLQALFWNQLLLPGTQKVSESDLKKFDAHLETSGDLVPVEFKNGSMSYSWKANRNTGRISEAEVVYQNGSQPSATLHFDYSNFKNVGVKLFPATQKLTFQAGNAKGKKEVMVNLDMNEVKTDANWDVETQVSSKYKQVSPEEVLNKIMSF